MNDLEKVVSEVFDRIMSLPVCENEDQRKGRKEVIDILRSVTGNDCRAMTNADRIRQMDNDELYDFLNTITDCCHAYVPKCEECPMKYKDTTPHCNISLWLKQEVEEGAEG